MSSDHRLSDYEPGVIEAAIVSLSDEYADLNAAANLLEETKGPVLSTYVCEFISSGNTLGKAEHLGKACPEYRDHIEKMVDARRLADRCKGRLEAKKMKFEAMRSIESTKRAEIQHMR